MLLIFCVAIGYRDLIGALALKGDQPLILVILEG
jgi:hypothetical protein